MIASAAAGNHEDCMALLLAGGGNPTHGECLPLALACINGDAPTIKLLLARPERKKNFRANDEHAIFLPSLCKTKSAWSALRLTQLFITVLIEDDGTVPTRHYGFSYKNQTSIERRSFVGQWRSNRKI
jgi:hypothetical protein